MRCRRPAIAALRLWGAGFCATLVLLAAPCAEATDVTQAQLADLAAGAAGGDSADLENLEAVTSVDGTPASPRTALAGAEGDAMTARLREIQATAEQNGSAEPGRSDPARVAAPGNSDGGGGGFSIPLLAPLIILGAFAGVLIAAQMLGRRRVLDIEASTNAVRATENDESAASLDRRADAAEQAGAYDEAIHLRFTAGLVRLNDAGVVHLRPSLTPSTAAREAGSATLGGLAETYSRVIYGGRAAGRDEAGDARVGWPVALREAGEGRG